MLLIGLVMCGLYYVAASIIFPGEFGDRADFDEHYIEHRRQVLGAMHHLRPDAARAGRHHPVRARCRRVSGTEAHCSSARC